MTDTAVDGRTLVLYGSIRDVTTSDIVRLRDGATTSDYDGASINRALRDVDLVVVNRDTSDNTVLIGVGDPITNRHWVKLHQLVQVVNSPAVPAPGTGWVPITVAVPPLKVGDTVRPKDGEGQNFYGGTLSRQMRGDGTITVTTMVDDTQFRANGGGSGGLSFHPNQFEVHRPLSIFDTPATKWENYVSFEQAKVGDVVRFRADKTQTGFGDDIEPGWRGIEAMIKKCDSNDSSVLLESEGTRPFWGSSTVWVGVTSLERQVPVPAAPALDPHKVSSYRNGTKWKMGQYTITINDEGELRESNSYSSRAPYPIPTGHIETQLRGEGEYTMELVEGGLKDTPDDTNVALPVVEPAKPEMYTEEWFQGFMERALEYANRHEMCGEVERFLESEGIDPGKLTAKTAVVDVTVTVQIEVDMSGRRAYDEGDLKYEVEKAVHSGLRNLDTSGMTDSHAQSFDGIRIGHPEVSATVAEVRNR